MPLNNNRGGWNKSRVSHIIKQIKTNRKKVIKQIMTTLKDPKKEFIKQE